MTKYREIIRLTGLGFSQRNIMASCGVSQKTVVKVQKRARELNISSVITFSTASLSVISRATYGAFVTAEPSATPL